MSQQTERPKATGALAFLQPTDGHIYLVVPRKGPYSPGARYRLTRDEALNLGKTLDRAIVRQEIENNQEVSK